MVAASPVRNARVPRALSEPTTIGGHLREVRCERKLIQRQVAAENRRHCATVGHWEKNQTVAADQHHAGRDPVPRLRPQSRADDALRANAVVQTAKRLVDQGGTVARRCGRVILVSLGADGAAFRGRAIGWCSTTARRQPHGSYALRGDRPRSLELRRAAQTPRRSSLFCRLGQCAAAPRPQNAGGKAILVALAARRACGSPLGVTVAGG